MISLDPVQENELPLIADLANRAFGTSFWDAEWVAGHRARHSVSLEDSRVARRDGTPVGYGLLGFTEPVGAWVTNIGVVQDARRQGVGRALLEALTSAAARHGHDWLRLAVEEENAAAVACYRSAGFEVERRDPTWETRLPEEPATGFIDNVVFRPMEEPLEMYDWYDALPLPFNNATFASYRHMPGHSVAFRATRHGETIAALYVTHGPDGTCRVAKLRLAEMADWVPEFLRAGGFPGCSLQIADPSGRYGQWFASWGYTPGPVRLWMRRATA